MKGESIMNDHSNVRSLPFSVANDQPTTSLESRRQEYFSDESELYFKTYERPLFYSGGPASDGINPNMYPVHSHKSIVRMIGDQPTSIGIVGKKYVPFEMKPLCEAVETTYAEVFDDDMLRGVQRFDRTAYDGATCVREYVFPSINRDINSNSKVAFRTVISNSCDGKASFRIYNGAIDFFCDNGMVIGSFDMMTKRHTSGLIIPEIAQRVRDAIHLFYHQADIWLQWANKRITDESARTCFEAIPGVSERLVDKLMRQFQIEVQSHGYTVWAMYSAATYYATHSEGEFKTRNTAKDHEAVTLLKRERSIQSWLDTETFEQIAA